jgi:electron transport complex protein RnfD
MGEVSLALIPGLLVLITSFGPGTLIQCGLSVLSALSAEAIALSLRKRSIQPTLLDGSALLTGLLLGVSLPPLLPWELSVFGSFFALWVGKHLYGGLGFNPFNPAMLGYAVLLIAFPKSMSQWPAPLAVDAGQFSWGFIEGAIFGGQPSMDAITRATPLDTFHQLKLGILPPDFVLNIPLTQNSERLHWAFVNLGFLLGGLWLLFRKLIPIAIPLGFLGSLLGLSLITFVLDPLHQPTPLYTLLSGGTMLGAFFITTDPVSGATTQRGRWIFAVGAGALVFAIRETGGYPDGIAFAILLMNLAAPTIDALTKPRTYGHPR